MSHVFYSLAEGGEVLTDVDVVQWPNTASLPLISLPPLYSLLISLSLVLSFLIPFIHLVCLALSISISFSLPSVRPCGSICLVYHPLCSPTDCQNHPSDETKHCCQTSVRRVAWPFAFRLCRDTEYFANAFYRRIFSSLVGWHRQAPTLFA